MTETQTPSINRGVHPLVALGGFATVYTADVLAYRVLPVSSWTYLAGLTLVLYVLAPVLVAVTSRVAIRAELLFKGGKSAVLTMWLIVGTVFLVPGYVSLNLVLASYSVDVRRMIYGDIREMRRILGSTAWPLVLLGGLGFAFAEELMFRGFLMNALRRWGAAAALIVSALCFAVAHHIAGKIIPMVLAGLWFGYVAMRTQSIWISTLAHFVVNSMLLGGVLYLGGNRPGRIQLPTVNPWWLIVFAVATAIVVIVSEWIARRPESAAENEAFTA